MGVRKRSQLKFGSSGSSWAQAGALAMERYVYLDIQRDLRVRTSLTFGRSRGDGRTELQAVGLGVVGSRPPRGPLGCRATSG